MDGEDNHEAYSHPKVDGAPVMPGQPPQEGHGFAGGTVACSDAIETATAGGKQNMQQKPRRCDEHEPDKCERVDDTI
jgi:hypothetical protein